jgi:hypothetical protein
MLIASHAISEVYLSRGLENRIDAIFKSVFVTELLFLPIFWAI